MLSRTEKSCGPSIPTLMPSRRDVSPMTGQESPVPGESAEETCAVERHGSREGASPFRQGVAPAGSNRSSREGNDPAEASDVKGH
jgi:hypothetical protein